MKVINQNLRGKLSLQGDWATGRTPEPEINCLDERVLAVSLVTLLPGASRKVGFV
jgi:hypothetical protein